MQIKKRLSLAQIKRRALAQAGINPSSYGQKKASVKMKNKKQSSPTRKLKHRREDE